MRPIHFILGLAFVTTVLIVNVDAIWCYSGALDEKSGKDLSVKTDCDTLDKSYTKCFSWAEEEDGKRAVLRGCASDDTCNARANQKGWHCCNSDYCNDVNNKNGAVTSTPPGPLLIAVITGVVAAVGI
ncbi:hypothetical protein AAVH_29460 [Aphelenchoides avenae]|nr:hypothetical protein AAVH_29460 [Aphelenchus avenae]